jgi:hypothetical protein
LRDLRTEQSASERANEPDGHRALRRALADFARALARQVANHRAAEDASDCAVGGAFTGQIHTPSVRPLTSRAQDPENRDAYDDHGTKTGDRDHECCRGCLAVGLFLTFADVRRQDLQKRLPPMADLPLRAPQF